MFLSLTVRKKLKKFRSIRRGYYSLIILTSLFVLSLGLELFMNRRAVLVKYEGNYYFPTYGDVIPGTTFGLESEFETNYHELKELFKDHPENYVLMPIVPYDQYFTDLRDIRDEKGNKLYPPRPPNASTEHYLGTDTTGRDILARVAYAFRSSMIFALLLTLIIIVVGNSVGCLMGYIGGRFDILTQRLLEMASGIHVLLCAIFFATIFPPSLWSLLFLLGILSWMGYTADMRVLTFREKAKDYVTAARGLGAGHLRIMFKYIIPNSIVVIIMALPFQISSGISNLTALSYLGFGLPPPEANFGELLEQGQQRINELWILGSAVATLVAILVMTTFIGEALREAFDPKKHTVYE
ncbi:MAG: ABC transporter permease subunit [Proteobacteria bacterium]|nr:ABC transporter permease subunit [Pseudomonadota bacterium]